METRYNEKGLGNIVEISSRIQAEFPYSREVVLKTLTEGYDIDESIANKALTLYSKSKEYQKGWKSLKLNTTRLACHYSNEDIHNICNILEQINIEKDIIKEVLFNPKGINKLVGKLMELPVNKWKVKSKGKYRRWQDTIYSTKIGPFKFFLEDNFFGEEEDGAMYTQHFKIYHKGKHIPLRLFNLNDFEIDELERKLYSQINEKIRSHIDLKKEQKRIRDDIKEKKKRKKAKLKEEIRNKKSMKELEKSLNLIS